MNRKEWFELFDNNKIVLTALMKDFHPFYKKKHDLPITAHRSEVVRQSIIAKMPKQVIEPSLETKNIKILLKILNQIWFGVPESISAHSLPGFGVLCDLCSDFPEDENDQDN